MSSLHSLSDTSEWSMKDGLCDLRLPACHKLIAGSKSAIGAEDSCTVRRSDNV